MKKIAVNDEKGGPFFRLPLLDVSIAPSEPLSQNHPFLKGVDIVARARNPPGSKGGSQPLALLPETRTRRTRPEGAAPLSLDIDEMSLAGGKKISFTDVSGSAPLPRVWNPSTRSTRFSNDKGKKSAPIALSLRTEARRGSQGRGGFSVDPLGSEGTFEVTSVPLEEVPPISISDSVLLDVEDGRLGLSAPHYRYE